MSRAEFVRRAVAIGVVASRVDAHREAIQHIATRTAAQMARVRTAVARDRVIAAANARLDALVLAAFDAPSKVVLS